MTVRLAAAPISWGVCEDPAWPALPSPDSVLAAMADLGHTATELGPEGWLGAQPDVILQRLERHGLAAIGGFHAERLHDRDDRAVVARVTAKLGELARVGADVLVLAADGDSTGSYSAGGNRLDRDDYNRLEKVLRRVIDELEGMPGQVMAIHPHVGTAIESRDDVLRLVERLARVGYPRIGVCLDTGHLVLGGMDPVELVREVPELVLHVHLKDLGELAADRVRVGGMPYIEAVRAGLYTPLGHGDIELEDVVRPLLDRGYEGWWVLEQDRFPHPERAQEDAMESLLVARELLGVAT